MCTTHGGAQQTTSTSCFHRGIVKGEKNKRVRAKIVFHVERRRAFPVSIHAAGDFHALHSTHRRRWVWF